MSLGKKSAVAALCLVACESNPSTAEAAAAVVGVLMEANKSGGSAGASTSGSTSSQEAPSPQAESLPPDVDGVVIDGSTRYEIIDGAAFRVESNGRVKVDDLYDPDYLDQNYVQRSDGIYRMGGGEAFLATRDVSENFDGVGDVRDLIGPERGWTSMTLQSPQAPTQSEYNRLANQVIDGRNFRDNTLAIVDLGPGYNTVLRTSAVAPSGRTDVSKASLDTGLVYFEPGDRVIIRGSFRIEGAMPVTIVDLESSYISASPGLRLLLEPNGRPRIELKWGTKPFIASVPGAAFQKDVWHAVEMTCELDVTEGRCTLDLDGERVIDGVAQTFPVRGQAYDRLQVGVTAHDGRSGSDASVVFVDNLRVLRR